MHFTVPSGFQGSAVFGLGRCVHGHRLCLSRRRWLDSQGLNYNQNVVTPGCVGFHPNNSSTVVRCLPLVLHVFMRDGFGGLGQNVDRRGGDGSGGGGDSAGLSFAAPSRCIDAWSHLDVSFGQQHVLDAY